MNKADFTEMLCDALEQSLADAEAVETNRRGVLVQMQNGEEWMLKVEKIRDATDSLDDDDDEEEDDDDEEEDDDDDV